jgi:hypothetical protein
MYEPMLPNPEIASASSGSVKRAVEAYERESQKTDSAQRLCKMAGNSRSPIYCTYSKRTQVSNL